MGKYSTYRKRGTYAPTEPSLPPPPAPDLYEADGYLISDTTGLPDAGGSLSLYICNSLGNNRVLQDQVIWAGQVYWGELGDMSEDYFIATETGNGIVYAGESEGSPIYQNVH